MALAAPETQVWFGYLTAQVGPSPPVSAALVLAARDDTGFTGVAPPGFCAHPLSAPIPVAIGEGGPEDDGPTVLVEVGFYPMADIVHFGNDPSEGVLLFTPSGAWPDATAVALLADVDGAPLDNDAGDFSLFRTPRRASLPP